MQKKSMVLCLAVLLLSAALAGCSAKDKQTVLMQNVSEQSKQLDKEVNESIELGNNYLKQGKYDEARKAYEKAISKDTSNKQNYLTIKDKYKEKSRFDDAYYFIRLAVINNVDTDNMQKILDEIKKNFPVINERITVYQGIKVILPDNDTFTIDDKDVKAAVKWNSEVVDTSKIGTFTYEGTAEEYGRTIKVTLIVTAKTNGSNNSSTTVNNSSSPGSSSNSTSSGENTKQNSQSSKAGESFFGQWTITKGLASGTVGTFSDEDISAMIGKTVIFSKDKANRSPETPGDLKEIVKNPVYNKTIVSKADFEADTRVTFDRLGIKGDSITKVEVSDNNDLETTFYIKDSNTLILYGGNEYFQLNKN